MNCFVPLQRPEDLWAIHSQPVFPKPHKRYNSSWKAIQKVTILELFYKYSVSISFIRHKIIKNLPSATLSLQITANGEVIGLDHFKPIKPLGSGDTGRCVLWFCFLICLLFFLFFFDTVHNDIYSINTFKPVNLFTTREHDLEWVKLVVFGLHVICQSPNPTWLPPLLLACCLVADHYVGCSVHLVELKGTGELFAMKAMDKSVMLNRNKVCSSKTILSFLGSCCLLQQ